MEEIMEKIIYGIIDEIKDLLIFMEKDEA